MDDSSHEVGENPENPASLKREIPILKNPMDFLGSMMVEHVNLWCLKLLRADVFVDSCDSIFKSWFMMFKIF